MIIHDKPIYVGFGILDLSQVLMYDFYHNHIKVRNGHCAKLLFIDTGSLVYEIAKYDVNKNFYIEKDLFNFSNYPKYPGFYDPMNKKGIAKMRDERKEILIDKLATLKSKRCSLVTLNSKEIKKAKHVNKNDVKASTNIRYKEYADVLFRKSIMRHRMKRIQSKLHRIGTNDICKISLLYFYDKCCMLDDGINSLVYFYSDKLTQEIKYWAYDTKIEGKK